MLPIQVELIDDLLLEFGTGEIFEVERSNNELSAKVKVMQDEEFLFSTSTWVPQERNGVKVRQINRNQ